MKLYLSSIGIPDSAELSKLLGKPLTEVVVALIPNAKDYYSKRAWDYTLNKRITYMKDFGFEVKVVNLQDYDSGDVLRDELSKCDLIWASGGNTFMLRYEMKRSGFDTIIKQILDDGVVYGGDSAGALVAGQFISGIESADIPEFAEEIINEGMGIVPYNILPHVDDPEFAAILPLFKNLHTEELIELADSQAVIFDNDSHRIISAQV